jgi:hypothetical protein
MNLNLFRGSDTQTDLVPADFQHCNYHVMADHDALVHVPRQYQQSSLLPWAMVESLVARAPNPGPLGRQFVRGPRTLFGAIRDGGPRRGPRFFAARSGTWRFGYLAGTRRGLGGQ